MAEKEFILNTHRRGARPRSKRLREMGGGSVSGGSTVVNVASTPGAGSADPNSHTHPNKYMLDMISVDDNGYLYLTQPVEELDDKGNIVIKYVTRKISAGIADLAKDLTEDSPVRGLFLSKLHDDIAKGNITFEKMISVLGKAKFGAYVPGLTGTGGQVDEYGNGELESLKLRRFLQVPSIHYNRTEIIVGDRWRAAGGVLEKVEPDANGTTGTAWLKLEDGELGQIEVGDICMGIFHAEESSKNATADSDDGRGNFQFAGFFTAYFTITAITGNDRKQFSYQIRPTSSRWNLTYHPEASMKFVCYGSFNEKKPERQNTEYSTRTYTRYLAHQNTWEIGKDNIQMQTGDLSNLNTFGIDASGYSTFQKNIYFMGELRQVKDDGTPILTAHDRGEYVPRTKYDYYDRVSYQGGLWLCVSESGATTEPAAGDPAWLCQVSPGSSLTSYSRWHSNMVPYPANSLLNFAGRVVLSKKETTQPPYPILKTKAGQYLIQKNGFYIMASDKINPDWTMILDASTIKDGTDGAGVELRYSADKTSWHSTFTTGDKYLQQRVGEEPWSEPMLFIGEPGAPGSDAPYVLFDFAVNSSLTEAPATGWQDAPPVVGKGQYLWMREGVVEPPASAPKEWHVARIGGEKGDKGDKGISIVTVDVEYAVSDSETEAPTVGWSTEYKPRTDGKYIWSRNVTYFTEGEPKTSNEACISGTAGPDGRGVASIKEQYYQSSSLYDLTGGIWSDNRPVRENGKYIWTKSIITYTDGSKPTETTPICNAGDKGDTLRPRGEWRTGMSIAPLDLVTMGGSSFVAKRATMYPPMWTLMTKDGRRLKMKNGGYILTGGMNTDDYMLSAGKGNEGKPGAPGRPGDKGDDGKQGLQGCIARPSEWVYGTQYRNDLDPIKYASLPVRYVDIALIRNDQTATGWDAYQCTTKADPFISIVSPDKDPDNWRIIPANFTAIFTSLIIAKNAKITFLSGNEILILDDAGKVSAGLSGKRIRIWAGSEDPDTAPFRVDDQGRAYASEMVIEGNSVFRSSIETYFKRIEDSDAQVVSGTYCLRKDLNILCRQLAFICLPTDISYVGKHIIIANNTDKTSGQYTHSHITIENDDIIHGAYLSDQDIANNMVPYAIQLKDGVVELIGIPDKTGSKTQWFLTIQSGRVKILKRRM